MKEERFECWALVELYGHQRIVGRVSEATIGGCSFIRVDVPTLEGVAGFTRYFGNNAIYSLSPVSEGIAMDLVKTCRCVPVQTYELPRPQGVTATEGAQPVDVCQEDDGTIDEETF